MRIVWNGMELSRAPFHSRIAFIRSAGSLASTTQFQFIHMILVALLKLCFQILTARSVQYSSRITRFSVFPAALRGNSLRMTTPHNC